MCWVVAVFSVLEAEEAEIVVGTLLACDEGRSTEFCKVNMSPGHECGVTLTNNAAVASTLVLLVSRCSLRFCGCWVNFLLWWQSFCVACINLSTLNRSLDEPVVFTITSDTLCNARGAKIEVAHLAFAAVVVLIRNRFTAAIAVNAECCAAEVVEVGDSWPTKR